MRYALTSFAAEKKTDTGGRIRMQRLREGSLQPQVAVDDQGILHLIYYSGDARQGNLFYLRSSNFGASFSRPLRVNSQSGSAVAAGTIRSGQLTVGKAGRVHVAWNGSRHAEPKGPLNPDSGKAGMPMLYTRLDDKANAFEPQRNLMHDSFGLDGGGSVSRLPTLWIARMRHQAHSQHRAE